MPTIKILFFSLFCFLHFAAFAQCDTTVFATFEKYTGRDFFVKVEASADSIYLGQSVTFKYYVYTKKDIKDIELKSELSCEREFAKNYPDSRDTTTVVHIMPDSVYYARKMVHLTHIYPQNIGTFHFDPAELSIRLVSEIEDMRGNKGCNWIISSYPKTLEVIPFYYREKHITTFDLKSLEYTTDLSESNKGIVRGQIKISGLGYNLFYEKPEFNLGKNAEVFFYVKFVSRDSLYGKEVQEITYDYEIHFKKADIYHLFPTIRFWNTNNNRVEYISGERKKVVIWTTVPKKTLRKKDTKSVNKLFLLDISGSMGVSVGDSTRFHVARHIYHKLSSEFHPKSYRMACYENDLFPADLLYLYQHEIDSMARTNLGTALLYSINYLNRQRKPKDHKEIFVISDGVNNMNPSVQLAAKVAQKLNIEINCLGVYHNEKLYPDVLRESYDQELLKEVAQITNGFYIEVNPASIDQDIWLSSLRKNNIMRPYEGDVEIDYWLVAYLVKMFNFNWTAE